MKDFISTKGTQDRYPGELAYQQRKSMTDMTHSQKCLSVKSIHLMVLNCSYIYFRRKFNFICLSLGVHFHKRGKGKHNGNCSTLKNVKSAFEGILQACKF